MMKVRESFSENDLGHQRGRLLFSELAREAGTPSIDFGNGVAILVDDLELDFNERGQLPSGEDSFRRTVSTDTLNKVTDHMKYDRDRTIKKVTDGKTQLDEETRPEYVNVMHSFRKFGLREIEIEEREGKKVLTGKYVLVSYPLYRHIQDSNLPAKELEFGTPTGISTIVETSDGKIILQNRSKKNALYPGVPGASVGGWWDADAERPDIKDYQKNIRKEALEEVGIKEEDIGELRVVGLAMDLKSINLCVIGYLKANISSEEMRNRTVDEATADSHDDFQEDFFIIPSSFDALETLLTEVKCPIPPNHLANYMAIAAIKYRQLLEQQGLTANALDKEVNAKLIELNQKIIANKEAIDSIVKAFGKEKYDPALNPEDQGLPTLASELERTGLL